MKELFCCDIIFYLRKISRGIIELSLMFETGICPCVFLTHECLKPLPLNLSCNTFIMNFLWTPCLNYLLTITSLENHSASVKVFCWFILQKVNTNIKKKNYLEVLYYVYWKSKCFRFNILHNSTSSKSKTNTLKIEELMFNIQKQNKVTKICKFWWMKLLRNFSLFFNYFLTFLAVSC